MAFSLVNEKVIVDAPTNCLEEVVKFNYKDAGNLSYSVEDFKNPTVETLVNIVSFARSHTIKVNIYKQNLHWNGLIKYNPILYTSSEPDVFFIVTKNHVKSVTGEMKFMFTDVCEIDFKEKLFGFDPYKYVNIEEIVPLKYQPRIWQTNGDVLSIFKRAYDRKRHPVKTTNINYRKRADELDEDLKFFSKCKQDLKGKQICTGCLKKYKPAFFDVGVCSFKCNLKNIEMDDTVKVPVFILTELKAKFDILTYLPLEKEDFSVDYQLKPSILRQLEEVSKKELQEVEMRLIKHKSFGIDRFVKRVSRFNLKKKLDENKVLRTVEEKIVKEEEEELKKKALILFRPLNFVFHVNMNIKEKCEVAYKKCFQPLTLSDEESQLILYRPLNLKKIKMKAIKVFNEIMDNLLRYVNRPRNSLIGISEKEGHCYKLFFKEKYHEQIVKSLPEALSLDDCIRLIEVCKEFLEKERFDLTFSVTSRGFHLKVGGFMSVREAIAFIKDRKETEFKIMRKRRKFVPDSVISPEGDISPLLNETIIKFHKMLANGDKDVFK